MARTNKTQAGFSIMETLVAIALLAIAMIPLISFQQSLAQSAARLQHATDRIEVQESAIAYLESIDPYASPNGEIDLGSWTLTWTSREIATEENANGYLGNSFYTITLFEIDAELSREPQTYTFSLRRVGWIQTKTGFN